MTYKELADMLDNTRKRKLCNNTYVVDRRDHLTYDYIAITLHGYEIMKFYRTGEIRLFSCGWKTVTTKERINRYLPQGYRLCQHNFVWTLQSADVGQLFNEGMCVYA